MSFFSRALERDIDRLVRESPIPKSIQYDEQEFSNLLHRSYVHHSRAQGTASVSATAKLQASTRASPMPTFNPFHSQQVLPHVSCELNESTQSVAELFNSLKRDASTAPASLFYNSSNTGYGGPRNLSIRGPPQGILDYQERLEDCFGTGGDKNHVDDSLREDREENTEDPELEACSLFMWIIKPEPELAAVRVEGKKRLRDSEFWQTGIVTQRLNEKLVKTQSGSVYKLEGNMIIMDTLAAGFSKSIAEAFWLGFPEDWEQLIQDHFNKFQYCREPINVAKGALPEQGVENGGQRSLVQDLLDLKVGVQAGPYFVNELQRNKLKKGDICVMEACDEQSEGGDDCAEIMDTSDVGLSEGTVEGIIDTLDRDINGEESAATDSDKEEDLRQSTEVVKPVKKVTAVKLKTNTTAKPTNKGKRSGVKEYTLSDWIIKPLPTGQGIHLMGLNQDGIVWCSSAIERRLDKKKLLTSGGSIYKLKGNLDTLMALEKGIPEKVIEKFKTGFPKEWLEIIQEHLNGNKTKHRHKSKSASRGRGKNDHICSENKENTPKNVQKPGNKRSVSEKSMRNKSLTSSKNKQNATIGSTIGKGTLSNKKLSKTSIQEERPSNVVFTPNGTVVDLDNLQHSRSGRLIKPPLSQWCGQQIRRGENGYYVTARTEYAKQYCAAIEDSIWNSGKRIRNEYYKQKNKENDITVSRTQLRKSIKNSNNGKYKKSESCASLHNSKVNLTVESAESDQQDIPYPDLSKEIETVLQKHKTANKKRKSERVSTVCYQNCQETKISDEKDKFCLDESDKEQNVDRIEKNSRKSKKLSENKVNQVSIVSSTTEDIRPSPLKTRSQTKSSEGTSLQENGTNCVTYAKRSDRKSRRLSRIIDNDSCSENVNTSLITVDISVKELHNKQSSSRLIEDKSNLDETTTSVDDSSWTGAEKHRLNRALQKVDSKDPEFWDKVTKLVRTKSAAACKEQFYSTEKSELGKKKKNLKKDVPMGRECPGQNPGIPLCLFYTEGPKVTALRANKGTLKRKQQLLDILKQYNENHTDKVFDATPFRKTRKRKMDNEREKCFEETLKRQGKTRFETPKAEDHGAKWQRFPRMMSDKKTPMSQVNIEENYEREQTDGYVHNLMKEGVHKKNLRKRLTTPKSTKAPKVSSNISPHKRLFFNAQHSDEENHLEENEDYYWEPDVTTE